MASPATRWWTRDGSTAAIVEEPYPPRHHPDIPGVSRNDPGGGQGPPDPGRYGRQTLAGMRVTGGSIVADAWNGNTRGGIDPPGRRPRRARKAVPTPAPPLAASFALVCRRLARQRLGSLQATPAPPRLTPCSTCPARINWRAGLAAVRLPSEKRRLEARAQEGWIVPIQLGYGALSGVHPPAA